MKTLVKGKAQVIYKKGLIELSGNVSRSRLWELSKLS